MVVFKRKRLTNDREQSDEECAWDDSIKVTHYKDTRSFTDSKCETNPKVTVDRRLVLQKNNLLTIARMTLVFGLYFLLTSRNNKITHDISNNISELTSDLNYLQMQINYTQQRLDKAHKNFHDLQQTTLGNKLEYDVENKPKNWTSVLSDHIVKNLKDHETQASEIQRLQEYVQYHHFIELEKRYGKGPYYIEMKLIIKGIPRYMTIETAPSHLVPHTLYVFMDMVDKKMWDNTILLHQWNHKVQAKAISPSAGPKQNTTKKALELSFIEYSEEYPHAAFTIGLSGRLGSSEFFINLEDNDNVYGRGKEQNGVLEDAYPCFAQVVIGKSTLAHLHQATVEALAQGPDGVIVTEIESMKIIKLSPQRLKDFGVIR